jgi:lipopolysaccharide/colanic/teichoic acid biosynthesis glycosyltransferase
MRSEPLPVETSSPSVLDLTEPVRTSSPAPGRVIRIHEQIDWDAFLPPRARTRGWAIGRAVKRALDVFCAAAGLLLLLPLFAILAVVVKLTSPGPVLYRNTYLGERARPFVGYKFRSMVNGADDMKWSMSHLNHMRGPAFKIRNDPRVTRVGRLLRKYSLDELPQLWSVLKGDMSLVGPRPPLPEEFQRYAAWQRGKLAVTPGITCYWQINGRSDIHEFDEWVQLDLRYIQEWSLWTDIKILVRTVPAVLGGHGAY